MIPALKYRQNPNINLKTQFWAPIKFLQNFLLINNFPALPTPPPKINKETKNKLMTWKKKYNAMKSSLKIIKRNLFKKNRKSLVIGRFIYEPASDLNKINFMYIAMSKEIVYITSLISTDLKLLNASIQVIIILLTH